MDDGVRTRLDHGSLPGRSNHETRQGAVIYLEDRHFAVVRKQMNNTKRNSEGRAEGSTGRIATREVHTGTRNPNTAPTALARTWFENDRKEPLPGEVGG